jgi:hypothetical protein
MAYEPEFKHHYTSVHAYLEQFVKIATKGKVRIEYALHVQRMRLECTVCGMTLTAAEPEGTTVDYGVQEFVKLHAHTGGHKDMATDPTQWPVGKAMTADFKPVTGGFGYVPLPPSANVLLKNIQMPGEAVVAVKPLKKEKPLKIATGRKFR